MADYQPFPITANKTGLFSYLESWIKPEDAYEPLDNAQVYRGVVSKRNGSIQLGNTLSDSMPVMGIMRYQNETTGNENLVVATTQNAYLFNDGAQTFNRLTSISASAFWKGHVPAGASTIPVAGTIPTFWQNLTASTVVIKAFLQATPTIVLDQVTDDGAGGWGAPTTGALFTGTGAIVYATGLVNFGTNSVVVGGVDILLTITATTTGNYFTGNITNFFNWTNWQPTDPTTFVTSTSYLYMVNNKDPVTLFDGTYLSRPIYYVNSAFTDFIKTTFDVKVYSNRLLFILPLLNSTSNPLNQSIFWSAQFNPFDFINDIQGHGGQLSAATGDILQSFSFLRNIAVVRFTRSSWTFRFTGNDFNPFAFNKINASKTTNCPYASIEYDERQTSIGSDGITACDGVNVQRFDVSIVDFYETQMSEQFYEQAFSQRYDNNSESWTLYCSQTNPNPLVGGIAPGSDQALIYNFLENTWATYFFSTPMTCLGLYHVITGKTWADMMFTWVSQDNPWNSYSNQKSAPTLLAGDTTGHVYWMDNGTQNTDNGRPILVTIFSKRWNPFIVLGQKVQFGYIDLYYQRNDDCVLTISFYVDNVGDPSSENPPSSTKTITLDANGTDGAAGSNNAMKRVYINAMGEFIQMSIQSASNARMQINGMVLWARPAGRLTP